MYSTGDKITKRLNIVFNEAQLDEFPNNEKFILAPEVKEVAGQLINLFRNDLIGWKIAYVFKKTAPKKKEGEVLGTARRETDLARVLHGFDGVVTISWDKWITMDSDQKARLVLHELEHLVPNIEKSCLEIAEHPVQEFPNVLKIFGPGQDSEIDFIIAYDKFKNDNSTLHDEIMLDRQNKTN